MIPKRLLPILLLLLAVSHTGCEFQGRKLPFYGEREAYQRKVDGKMVTDTLYHTIPEFRLLNQDSTMLASKFFDGKIYIADFFFTSCPTTCPLMHRNLVKIYQHFKNEQQVLFLSHSVDFKHDSPSVLKAYSTKLGVADKRWQFVTGPREVIYPLAEQSYISSAQVEPGVPGGYAHSGYFILVDRHRRVRGAYDGTDQKSALQLIEDVQLLLHEK
jgi:protein SCO1/2